MSTRKAQPLQMCEPVPGLQILVKLSNTPFVRTVITTVTHHQLAIVGLVFVTTLLFVMRENAPWLTVPKQVAIEFFSAVSQSLAALLGVLIVFLTFTSQLIAQRRYEDYYTLQIQIDQLIRLTQSLPTELSNFEQTLIALINYLVPLHLKDFPIWATSSQMPPLDKLLDNFKDEYEWTQVQQNSSLATHLQQQQILLVINNMEEILERFSRLYNRILEISRFILAIVKLAFLLGVSLLFLLLFGIIDLQRKFPDLSLPVIVSLAIWVLIALLELVLDTWFFYKSLYGSSSHYLRFFPNSKHPN
ncbi:hypothetical protein CDG77_31475 [Nostoc sp. 'Peltigera membranacea cyanobiont' 213]|uniref:hypothetical protein n=1 Tax=Nostoc sp. 'Peltigera membranacea cyanobiont' 213 TaxID=2014530 RepID=UPI000B952881|nr:hypothetical protein [Nostoc sp. 'Peltigera membranacea cyanobiont' 213]OYD87062.1 hypothetical protein CDG77_31475 [Nostoc sp. 'Peltigera membranacea cyanobiont' 213]